MKENGRIAQSVEQGIENPRVPGSIPGPATISTRCDSMLENKSDKPSISTPMESTVEQICEQGCSTVREHIEILSLLQQEPRIHHTNNLPELLKQTSPLQQQEILQELKTIMAVYDDKDCQQN